MRLNPFVKATQEVTSTWEEGMRKEILEILEVCTPDIIADVGFGELGRLSPDPSEAFRDCLRHRIDRRFVTKKGEFFEGLSQALLELNPKVGSVRRGVKGSQACHGEPDLVVQMQEDDLVIGVECQSSDHTKNGDSKKNLAAKGGHWLEAPNRNLYTLVFYGDGCTRYGNKENPGDTRVRLISGRNVFRFLTGSENGFDDIAAKILEFQSKSHQDIIRVHLPAAIQRLVQEIQDRRRYHGWLTSNGTFNFRGIMHLAKGARVTPRESLPDEDPFAGLFENIDEEDC